MKKQHTMEGKIDKNEVIIIFLGEWKEYPPKGVDIELGKGKLSARILIEKLVEKTKQTDN